jgi:2-acylglycerol O-acyltransferase 1
VVERFGTGFSYPVPWSQIPENIYCTLSMISCLWGTRVKRLNAARSAHGINDTLACFSPWVKDVPHICPSLPEIDLPMTIPSNVHLCGPIMLAATPVARRDPALLKWLQKAPTVLISMGTNHEARAEIVQEMALGIRILLDTRSDIQVLWKLRADKSSQNEDDRMVSDMLGEDIKNGRVKIESWLKADPVAILETGNIVCFVHHGGANSWFEATW